VWSVIGGLSRETSLPITTAVTCPTVRIHPAVVAQAAATSALMTGGRFVLGVGTGEALNEQVTGAAWPLAAERMEMLEEAVEVMRALWAGDVVTHHGRHYVVEHARIYTLPETPPPVYVSGLAPAAAELTCGPDVEAHVTAMQAYLDAGFDEVYVNQIGPVQDEFFNVYGKEVLPELRRRAQSSG
jgi:G6PDH family F420-dependent oxidoreductase